MRWRLLRALEKRWRLGVKGGHAMAGRHNNVSSSSYFICRIIQSLRNLTIILTGTQGSMILRLSNTTLFLNFQTVQKIAYTPAIIKHYSLDLNVTLQLSNKALVLSGISRRLKAHFKIFQNILDIEHFMKR